VTGLLVELSRLVPFGDLGADDLLSIGLAEDTPGRLGGAQALDGPGEMLIPAGCRRARRV
jgi:hypothetical protein